MTARGRAPRARQRGRRCAGGATRARTGAGLEVGGALDPGDHLHHGQLAPEGLEHLPPGYERSSGCTESSGSMRALFPARPADRRARRSSGAASWSSLPLPATATTYSTRPYRPRQGRLLPASDGLPPRPAQQPPCPGPQGRRPARDPVLTPPLQEGADSRPPTGAGPWRGRRPPRRRAAPAGTRARRATRARPRARELRTRERAAGRRPRAAKQERAGAPHPARAWFPACHGRPAGRRRGARPARTVLARGAEVNR